MRAGLIKYFVLPWDNEFRRCICVGASATSGAHWDTLRRAFPRPVQRRSENDGLIIADRTAISCVRRPCTNSLLSRIVRVSALLKCRTGHTVGPALVKINIYFVSPFRRESHASNPSSSVDFPSVRALATLFFHSAQKFTQDAIIKKII